MDTTKEVIYGNGIDARDSWGGHDLDVITATAGDVVAGKVIVDKDGNPLTGTLALTGNVGTADVRNGKTFYSTDPKTKQTGSMREKGAATYTPGTANQVIAANQFLTGAQTILGDADLVAANIRYGKNIFGVTGNLRQWVTKGGTYGTSGTGTFQLTGGGSRSMPYISLSGFNFTPQFVCACKTDYTAMTSWYNNYNALYTGTSGLSIASKSGSAKWQYNNIVMPVYTSGDYWVYFGGYQN